MKYPRFFWYEWLMILLSLGVILFLLLGCGPRGSVQDITEKSAAGGIGSVVSNLSLYLTALATLGFVGFLVAAFFTGHWLKFGRAACACLLAISGSQFAYWYGKHVGIITWLLVVAAVVCVVGWAWFHRQLLEKKTGLDLNRDGKIG